MSEEGGFDDVAEFFLAAANCSRTCANSASSVATLDENTWHCGHISDVDFIANV
jgi:hypothetical protein